jgi:hypothetical protein
MTRNRLRIAINCLAGSMAALTMTGIANADEATDPEESPKFSESDVEFFQTKVHPLLKARCFKCHSKDAKRLEGELRLDARPLLLAGGETGPAAVPNEPAESLMIEAILYESLEMPPTGRLPEGEIAILTKWVELGLPWTDEGLTVAIEEKLFPLEERKKSHWAWQPIRDVAAPAVKNAEWAHSAVDRFILAELEARNLDPAPPADRRTLIRRVSFDLIGLPPTPEQVQEFLADKSPTQDALARVIDTLLESPHFGERWARHWLDLVRYAETLGHEFDYKLKYAHHYRDYVIRAINADVPYDQFVREHVAGDLIKNPRRNPVDGTSESIIGTGFWFLGELKHAPVDVKGEEATVVDNQLDVFSKTFLGLTVACARCHDHKFDAISARDYYALSGFLQSSRRQHAYVDPEGRIEKAVSQLKELHATADELIATSVSDSTGNAVDRTARLLLASREVLFGSPKPGDSDVPSGKRGDILLADFEREDFGDWKAEGAAFAKGPVTGTLQRQQKVSGFSGKRLVNSYVGGDDATGRLTSPEFVIDRNRIQFLIGGGAHKGRTCMNLLVNGKVVRTATGKANERLDAHVWDVSDLQLALAVIQIVDEQKGGWGHVNVDHIVLTDSGDSTLTKRPIIVVAKEQRVDPKLLTRWVRALSDDKLKSASHPLFAWRELAQSPDADLAAARARVSARLKTAVTAREQFESQTELIDDFDDGNFDGWFSTGWAFGDAPLQPLGWSRSKAPSLPGAISSGRYGNKLRGVLRSPEFTLTKPSILYRFAGHNVTVRLIIDNYVMDEYNGLLFRGCRFDLKNEQLHWFRQGGDVRNHVGHRAHIELIDEGDGWIVVDEIQLAEGGTAQVDPVSAASMLIADRDDINTQQALALAVARLFSSSRDHASDGAEQLAGWLGSQNLVADDGVAAKLATLREKADRIANQIPAPQYVLAMTDGTGENEHVFIRGSHANPGPVAPRRMLEAISGSNQPEFDDEGSGRLELAERLLAPSNPFPARVMANRIWHHLFGRGIVASVDNFGVLGERPTHPELLDHLATRFVAEGWSVKSLIRSLLLTQTYQMDSRVNPDYADIDPVNKWWHRMPIRRLQGEAIRDAMLTISGRLDPTTFGPPVPVHVTPFMQGRGRPRSGPLDGNGRRSIYVSVNRNFLSPMMLAFDTPIPFNAIGRRTVSNVPAQALILMNDPFVIQQAQLWAKRELADSDVAPADRINRLYEQAFARPPQDDELTDGLDFLEQQAASYGAGDTWQTNEQAWSDLCHVLFNVKEFVFVK